MSIDWSAILLPPDTRANQPAATAVKTGALYAVTDEDFLVERSNGATWVQFGPTPGGGGGGSGSLVVVVKAADESITSSTTFQDDDALVIAIAANQKMSITFNLQCVGTRPKVQVTAPSGATGHVLDYPNGAIYDINTAFTTNPFAGADPGSAAQYVANIINGATPGNVVLSWAQSFSSGTASTIKKHSSAIANIQA